MQLQGIEEPERKFFWPAVLLWQNEEECDDDDEAEDHKDNEDDLLPVRTVVLS